MTRPDVEAVAGPQAELAWERLDRRSIWAGAVKPALGLLGTGAIIVTLRGWDRLGWVEPTIGAVVVVGLLVLSAWYWATTRYRVTPTHVELTSGMLVRSRRSVPRDRLRSVDLTVDVVHRLAGLAVVAIGTGRQGGDADDVVKLESLSTAQAQHLRAVLLDRGPRPAGPAADPAAETAPDVAAPADPPPMAAFAASWVRFAPLSLLGLISLGLLLAAIGQFRDLIDYRALAGSGPVQALLRWAGEAPLPVVVLLVLLVLVVVNTVLSTVLYVLFYGGYRLTRRPDRTLHVTYGLLTQRSVTIEEARIRGVRVDEPLLLRSGGGARAKVIAAGLGVKDAQGKEKRDSDLLLPSAPAPLVHRVTADVLGSPDSPAAGPLRPHPRTALRVLLLREVPVSLLPAVGLAVPAVLGTGFPHWPWQVALLLVPVAVGSALLAYRSLGHARHGAFLVAREGAGIRKTAVLRCDGIIAWRFRRTVFQRRPRLLSGAAAVAAGSGAHWIRYASQDDVLAVADDAVPGLLTPFLELDQA